LEKGVEMIERLTGKYKAFGNFYIQQNPIYILDGRGQKLWFNHVEGAYQASKRITRRSEFLGLSPREAKQKGQTVICRSGWDDMKYAIMAELIDQKFRANPDLIDLLLETGDEEIQGGNSHGDKIWGRVQYNGKAWDGKNWLGKILMNLRKKLREELTQSNINKKEQGNGNETD